MSDTGGPREVALYPYLDRDGNLLFEVIRYLKPTGEKSSANVDYIRIYESLLLHKLGFGNGFGKPGFPHGADHGKSL